MADRYIDVFEVTEYGDHFLDTVKQLSGASPLVNVEPLRARVQAEKEKVESERTAAGLVEGGQRQGSTAVDQAAASLRGTVGRFHSYLHSLDPAEESFDLEGFFPGGNLGSVAQLKPADLDAYAEKLLGGFQLTANQSFSQRDSWKGRLEQGRAALKAALSERAAGSALPTKLAAAREGFLDVYNGVAKPLVRGLLNELGRGGEFTRYFKDLQVNEGPRSAPEAPATPPTTEKVA